MKKYEKPMLYAENFALCEHIAGCVYEVHHSVDDCAFEDHGMVLFAASTDACDNGMTFTNMGLTPAVENIKKLGYDCYTMFIGLTAGTIVTS